MIPRFVTVMINGKAQCDHCGMLMEGACESGLELTFNLQGTYACGTRLALCQKCANEAGGIATLVDKLWNTVAEFKNWEAKDEIQSHL